MAHPGGRPTIYTKELAEEICLEVATTTKMLEKLCDSNDHWPSAKTIYKWRIKHEEFGQMYAYAKQCQIEPLVSHIFNIVNEESKDFYHDEEGKKSINYAHLQKLKMEVDSLKWLAAKLAPKIYGDKVHSTHDVKVKQEDSIKDLD